MGMVIVPCNSLADFATIINGSVNYIVFNSAKWIYNCANNGSGDCSFL
jgi:hypothetical protein